MYSQSKERLVRGGLISRDDLRLLRCSISQAPVRKQLGHASTGHAASPVTIVVGRASKRQVTHPVGAPPKVVLNTAISKKNLNMDEDLSGNDTPEILTAGLGFFWGSYSVCYILSF